VTNTTKSVKTAPKPKPKPENNSQVPPAEEQEPARWKMPKPCRGQVVVFYNNGAKSKKNAAIGFALSIGEAAIDVTYRGIKYQEVLHIDDPRLQNDDTRNEIGGAWDFTDEHKELVKTIRELTERVEALENN
jgi:hypothetical protein